MATNAGAIQVTSELLCELFDRIICNARDRAVDSLATSELSISQVRMLFTLQKAEAPLSINDLADQVGLSLAAAGRGADRLVILGLIDRREDAIDRRVKRLSLTESGESIIQEQFSMKSADLNQVVGAIPDEPRERLVGAIRAVLDYLPAAPTKFPHACGAKTPDRPLSRSTTS